MQNRPASQFYQATDFELDSNGLMSLCKECIGNLFDSYMMSTGTIEEAMLKLCKKMNMRYSQEAIDAAKQQIKEYQESGKSTNNFVGVYKTKLATMQSGRGGSNKNENLEYEEMTQITINAQDAITLDNINEDEVEMNVVLYWGEGFEQKDYRWLEAKMAEWKKTHRSDTQAEQELLRYIVLKQFEIEDARRGKKSTSSLLKELQDLMKTSAVDPAKATTANAGKSQDTFSAFIKIIEENRPAEYYKDKALFKDYDNLDYYFRKYVVRPLKNFITQSRDFSLDDAEENEDELIEIDNTLGEDTELDIAQDGMLPQE